MATITELSVRHYKWIHKMGWHNKTALECLALVCGEVGEAVNECRGLLPTDRLGSELADIVLRVMDLAVMFGIDLEKAILNKMAINESGEELKPGRIK